MHTIKLAAHFPYLIMIKHGLACKWCTVIVSQFLSISFFCPWLLLSFWGHFRKVHLAYCQSSSGHWDRKGHHVYGTHSLGIWVCIFFWGGGHHRNFFWTIKYISCSACFVIYMPKRCLIFLYWNNIGIIIIITMMILVPPQDLVPYAQRVVRVMGAAALISSLSHTPTHSHTCTNTHTQI